MTWERIKIAEPIDVTARIVTSPGPKYEAYSSGWAPGAFSRVLVPYKADKLSGRKLGLLTVMGRRIDKTMGGWNFVCRCNCGNYVLARARHIRHQSVRMCGECETTMDRSGADKPSREFGKHFSKKRIGV
jgi:predicted RNA-binding Zn-ribbon protein involved in translation (DUF1610 family)